MAGWGAFNNYVDKMRGGVKKCRFLSTLRVLKLSTHGGVGGVKKWQNSVHVVVECPLNDIYQAVTVRNDL